MYRLEALGFYAPACRANIRIIAPDRPGIGHSSFLPDRTVTDHADDVEALSRHLNLQRFAILGVSRGTPYALACASTLPGDRLSGVGILSGMGTYEESDLGLVPTPSRVTGWLARNVPHTLRVITDMFVAGLQWVVKWRWVQKRLDQFLQEAKKAKDEWEKNTLGPLAQDEGHKKWTPAASRERLLNSLFEPFHQGLEGVVQEAAIVSVLGF